jgi:hypothetical protein
MKVVFVHFGRNLPDHLILNLKRVGLLFPHLDVLLITNESCKLPKSSLFTTFIYTPGKTWKEIEQTLSHDKSFRENFWLTSLVRLIAIDEYMSTINSEVIHIESDVTISPDFPFEKFRDLPRNIAYPIISQKSAIASVLYLRSSIASKVLTEKIISSVRQNSYATDMQILISFYCENPDLVQPLPVGPTYSKEIYNADIPRLLLAEMDISRSILGGIIDGADLGQYLFGQDPRNLRGKRILRQEINNHFLKPRSLDFLYSDKRQFIDLSSQSRVSPVFALHIHSKNKDLFRRGTLERVLRGAVNNAKLPSSFDFLPSIYLNIIYLAVVRRVKKTLKIIVKESNAY